MAGTPASDGGQRYHRPGMLAAGDVAYGQGVAVAAAVWWNDWGAAEPEGETVWCGPVTAPYRSGALQARELPALLEVLAALPRSPTLVLVDGYVWLDGQQSKGLGGHLFARLGGATAVVGVAKRAKPGAPAVPVWRGGSRRPLWVSAAGVEVSWAAAQVERMHGPFRLPTLLRRVDQLARRHLAGLSGPGRPMTL